MRNWTASRAASSVVGKKPTQSSSLSSCTELWLTLLRCIWRGHFHFPLAQTLEITHVLVEIGWCYLLTGKAELRPTKASALLPSIISQNIKESNFRASVRVVRSQQNLLVQCHQFELFFICWMKGFAIFFCRKKKKKKDIFTVVIN